MDARGLDLTALFWKLVLMGSHVLLLPKPTALWL